MKAVLVMALALAGLTSLPGNAEPSPQQAEDQHWYAVEVIVFKPTASMAGGDEMWPSDPKLPDVADAVVPTEPTEPSEPAAALPMPLTLNTPRTIPLAATVAPEVTPLPTTDYKLDGIWQRLQSSGRYQTLLHTGWIQQGKPRSRAQAISITPLVTPAPAVTAPAMAPTNNVYGDAAMMPALPMPATAAPSAPALPTPATASPPVPMPPSGAPVFGTVTLSLDRYLHLAVDMAYRPTGSEILRTYQSANGLALPSTSTATLPAGIGFGALPLTPRAPTAVVLDQSRRIQPGAVDYFDHPLFGAIIEVTPVPAPAGEIAPPQDPIGN